MTTDSSYFVYIAAGIVAIIIGLVVLSQKKYQQPKRRK